MRNFFRFESQPQWDPYIGSSGISGLMKQKRPQQQQSTMRQMAPQQQMAPQMMMPQAQGEAPPPPAAGIDVGQIVDTGREIYDAVTRKPPEVAPVGAELTNPAGNYTGSNPYDPANYEGTLYDTENPFGLEGPAQVTEPAPPPVFDSANYEGTLSGTADQSNPVFQNNGQYEGTLYDPNNPLGLSEAEWVAQTGLMNSGSLLNNSVSADLAGISDEIVAQGSDSLADTAGGMMDGAGKLIAGAGLAKGIYGLTQGSGAQGGVDLAAGVGAYFVPAFGWVKAGYDAAMGIGQYVRAQGRQHDYRHPYLNSQVQGANGSTVMNVNYADTQGDGTNSNDGQFTMDQDPYGINGGQGIAGQTGNIVEKDGQYYYINDIADYLGIDSYGDYLAGNGMARPDAALNYAGMGGTTEQGDWQREMENSGLLGFRDYQNYLNDAFLNQITTEGVNFDSDAVKRARHGMFKGQDTMGTTWQGDKISQLVKMGEMNQFVKNNEGNYFDTGYLADYQAPVLPTYSRPETAPVDYSLYGI